MRAILTYHSIDSSNSPISMAESEFEQHVHFFTSGRVRVVTLEQLLRLPESVDALALTFDDGFDNFASLAWPRLRSAGLPVTLFVASRRAGSSNAWGDQEAPGIPTLPLLGFERLRQLAAEGLEIGSHSQNHPHLTQLSDADLERELADSARDLERELGRRPAAFCYPWGDVDERVARAASAHYTSACTTELDILRPHIDAHRLPRLDAYYYRAPSRLARWGSNSFKAHLWLRRTARTLRAHWSPH